MHQVRLWQVVTFKFKAQRRRYSVALLSLHFFLLKFARSPSPSLACTALCSLASRLGPTAPESHRMSSSHRAFLQRMVARICKGTQGAEADIVRMRAILQLSQKFVQKPYDKPSRCVFFGEFSLMSVTIGSICSAEPTGTWENLSSARCQVNLGVGPWGGGS